VRYEYESPVAILEADQPVIVPGRGVRVNNRSKRLPQAPVEVQRDWYAAYAELAALLESEENVVRLRLAPGDLLCFDNERVLHGRTAFHGGERLLHGCYADRDGLRSTLALLRRRAGVVDVIFERFASHGDSSYLGEPVTLTEHMLQTALAAEADGAEASLVAAALLHDYGHLIHDLPEDSAEHGVDTRHEDVGFEFLARHFPPEVVDPVRLHVAAKRYLCAVEPAYLEQLSDASRLSLDLQGGPFDADAVREFEALPHWQDAVRLRRYDDAGKEPSRSVPALEGYRALLEAMLAG
jgi:gamma-butyrobetaine dioxygenase